MATSASYRAFVKEQLESAVGGIFTRKMFGGVGIYCEQLFFALISSTDVLYFKVDDTNRPDFEAAGMGPFKPFEDKDEVMKYYEVPVEVLENVEELRVWANKAIAVAERAKK